MTRPRFVVYPSPVESERERASVRTFHTLYDGFQTIAYGDPAEAMLLLVKVRKRLQRLTQAVQAEVDGAA